MFSLPRECAQGEWCGFCMRRGEEESLVCYTDWPPSGTPAHLQLPLRREEGFTQTLGLLDGRQMDRAKTQWQFDIKLLSCQWSSSRVFVVFGAGYGKFIGLVKFSGQISHLSVLGKSVRLSFYLSSAKSDRVKNLFNKPGRIWPKVWIFLNKFECRLEFQKKIVGVHRRLHQLRATSLKEGVERGWDFKLIVARLWGKGTQLGREEEKEEIILMDCSSVVWLFHTSTWAVCVGVWLRGFIGLESFLPLSSEISLKSGGEICCKWRDWPRNNAMSSYSLLIFFCYTLFWNCTHLLHSKLWVGRFGLGGLSTAILAVVPSRLQWEDWERIVLLKGFSWAEQDEC